MSFPDKSNSLGRRCLVGTILVGSLSLGGCGNGGPDGPNGPEPGNPPETPSIMQVLALAQEPSRGMHVAIYDASDNEDGFVLERKTQGSTFAQIANLSPDIETYDDWGLGISIPYTYRIRAYNQFGSSDWSTEKTGTSAGPEPNYVFIYPMADAYVDQRYPTTNYGDDTYLLVTERESGEKRAYLEFSYNEIPSYAIDIDVAELRLICQNEPSAGAMEVYVGDLAEDFYENSVTWNNRPIERGLLVDHEYVYNNGQPVFWDITEIVKDWFNGVTLNHGIVLRGFLAPSEGQAVLYSRERTDLRPLLSVKYYW